MLIKQIKLLNVLQCSFILAYLLILLFGSLGTFQIDLDIQYIRAPENGFYGDITTSLDFGVFEKILITCILIAELILFHVHKIKMAILNIILCAIRTIPSLVHILIVLLAIFSEGNVFSIDITIFVYLLLFLCIGSLICHVLNFKK